MAKTFKSFEDIVEASVKRGYSKEYNVKGVELEVEGKTLRPYTVAIANRDLLFFCDVGTVNYVVDTYAGKNWVELFDWSFGDE